MPKQDILMLVGDFKAQIERELCYQEVAGSHTRPIRMEKCDLAAAINIMIMSTKFKHKAIHKITWIVSGKTTGNQIDHVLIGKENSNVINDTRSYRGAYIDHIFVIVKCKIKVATKQNNGVKEGKV